MTPSTSRSNTFILLFYLLFPFIHTSCPKKCANGYNVHDCKCESNCYRQLKQGIQTCQRCTEMCSEDKNQMEVTPCTLESNRVCFCKPGFYCEKRYNYDTYCHKPCVPCEMGTFSSKPSLNPACTRHKDCAQLGMITLKEGTTTQDRECVYTTTKMASLSTLSSTNNTIYINTTSTPRTAIHGSLDKEGTATQDGESVYATTKMAASSTPSSTNNTIYTNSTSTLRTEGIPQPIDQDKEKREFHWLLLLILLLMLLFMAGFCMLMKGLINGEHEEQQHSSLMAGDHQILSNSQSNSSIDMETKIPLGSDVREVKGQSMEMIPQSGVVRQVTVEHNGRGENVNNTVGSIYIYSPGTVILGSNSGDKKEEAGVCEEARPLIGSPQQESNPPSQEVRIRMSAQEEAEEELSLSFPVPATGK
ncbi:uncharacterized protein si:dkeyp-61b2.1 isoform X2 [Ctenopharyngodon idella]|uniref:uncharacterized protein si:dkeyp-61b2.1 isoform X2 n=1 Tax=Ctenopharyngodon idella TaxID=7959 RepID=UPI0022316FE6|nr:uncharacterized protein si:dkeyp-61b2.1 isoform X2 [Ctenopharyngodon idella]